MVALSMSLSRSCVNVCPTKHFSLSAFSLPHNNNSCWERVLILSRTGYRMAVRLCPSQLVKPRQATPSRLCGRSCKRELTRRRSAAAVFCLFIDHAAPRGMGAWCMRCLRLGRRLTPSPRGWDSLRLCTLLRVPGTPKRCGPCCQWRAARSTRRKMVPGESRGCSRYGLIVIICRVWQSSQCLRHSKLVERAWMKGRSVTTMIIATGCARGAYCSFEKPLIIAVESQ